MHITLIGMSNIGKSHWAKQLADKAGFERVDCDTLIEKKLGPELSSLGHSGTKGVAAWMGQPYDPQYQATSAKYREYEREVMLNIIERLKSPETKSHPIVVDTSGSVIYMSADNADQLRSLTRVVYLEASPEHRTALFTRYMDEPKPVVWGDAFARKDGEADMDALKRCYPDLLATRAALYKKMAHVTIPYERHKGADVSLILTEAGSR